LKKKIDFNAVANKFMFSGMKISDIVECFGLQYRKGKDHVDLLMANQKAVMHGRGKTEHELRMLEIYLRDVFRLIEKEVN